MKHALSYLIVVLILPESSCSRNGFDKSDIRRTWYKITNNATYEEFIATELEFYTYDENVGDLFVQYRVEGDSLKMFWHGENTLTYKYQRIDEDRFSLTSPRFRSICYRLYANIDTVKIPSTKKSIGRHFDEDYFVSYVKDLRRRRFEWQEKNDSR